MKQNSDFNRSLSQIFSPPVFKTILKTGHCDYFFDKLKRYQSVLCLETHQKVKDVFQSAYSYLSRHYRNEYIYKNTIANEILLKRHNLNTTTMLSEFKIASSIADLLLLNGTATAYEIKTELDSPDKLKKQIHDYQKAFPKVYLVTHYSLAEKYLLALGMNSVGLLSLNDQFMLSTLKEAVVDYSSLDVVVMMKCLRKAEYTSILQQYYGFIPKVSNIHYFSSCLELAIDMDSSVFYSLMLVQLKQRIPISKDYLKFGALPRELTHLCLCLNPSVTEYNNLFRFLNKSV